MTDPIRQDWPAIIARIEAAGISHYKLGTMLRPPCQHHQVKRWADRELWESGTEPSHFHGEQIKAIEAEFAVVAAPEQ